MIIKSAVKGRVPLVAVRLEDTVFAHEVLKAHLDSAQSLKAYESGMPEEGGVYYKVSKSGKGPGDAQDLYKAFEKAKAVLLYVNIDYPQSEFLDLGPLAPPAKLLKSCLAATVPPGHLDEACKALGGAAIKDALTIVKITMARDDKITSDGLLATRKELLKTSKGLVLLDPYMAAYKPDKDLKVWLDTEKDFFLKGSDSRLRPRGLLFDGPPGTGKTQGAKYIASQYGIPIFRLAETFLDKWQGNSENFFQQALMTATAAAPCVLLIDEIEKFFSGSANENTGTMSRVMGSLLWWLQEHDAQVLTVMTTNNRKRIPPELYREGRIDKVFTFGLLECADALEVAAVVYQSYSGTPEVPPPLAALVKKAAAESEQSFEGKKGIAPTTVTTIVKNFVKSQQLMEQAD